MNTEEKQEKILETTIKQSIYIDLHRIQNDIIRTVKDRRDEIYFHRKTVFQFIEALHTSMIMILTSYSEKELIYLDILNTHDFIRFYKFGIREVSEESEPQSLDSVNHLVNVFYNTFKKREKAEHVIYKLKYIYGDEVTYIEDGISYQSYEAAEEYKKFIKSRISDSKIIIYKQ